MLRSRPSGRSRPTLSISEAAVTSPNHGRVNPLLTSRAQYLRSEGPYITYEMIKRQQERVSYTQDSKKKWITKTGFRSAARSFERFIPNYVQASPSENPSLHVFRDTDRRRWLAGAFRPSAYLSHPD